MRDIVYSVCVLIALVIGLFLGSVITERRVAPYLESETDKIDRAEEKADRTPAVRVASARPEPERWYQPEEWTIGMSRRAR